MSCNESSKLRNEKNLYFSTMKKILLFCLILLSVQGIAQKKYAPFSGRLVYRIEFKGAADSAFAMQSKTSIYTNDTLVRIESESGQLGPQVLIKHLLLQKYYLLLEYNDKKYAIQQHMPADTTLSKYTFKKKFGKKKIAGIKAKKVVVNSQSFAEPLTMWYFPTISPKYLDVLKGIKGLPVDYYIQMEDGYLHYILESIEISPVNMDLFGIPSDFKKVSFDEFMDDMMNSDK